MQDYALASSSGQTALDNHSLSFEHFRQTLTGLSSVLPFSKLLGEEAWLLLWLTFPDHAKQHLTPAMWTYAAGQRLMDPEPAKELPIHLQLLRYLYRLENGMPNFTWGLKLDLPQRMAQLGTFHQPEPRSIADVVAAEGPPNHDGSRHEPAGVLAQFGWTL
jgi:hypothetical protein